MTTPTPLRPDAPERTVDYVWASRSMIVRESGLTFVEPSPDDPTLYPSDHYGVSAVLEITQ